MSPQPNSGIPPKKALVFRILSLLGALGCGVFLLGAAEWGLRWKRQAAPQSDHLDPNLIRYDSWLGWSLNPGTSGGHTNSDFGTYYRVADTGFRADATVPRDRSTKLHVFVGDSFVFGFGVKENETFVHLLNSRAADKAHFLNCGIPGYSSDQELLLIERRILDLKPDVIWLVVCLANDLLDIQQAVPMQVNHPKPFFELVGGHLELRNSPVPRAGTETAGRQPDLALSILGPEFFRNNWRASLEKRSLLFQIMSEGFLPAPDVERQIADRLAPSVSLFSSLLSRIEAGCRERSVQLRLAFMPGRSMVEKPKSIPGQYQRMVVERLREQTNIARLKPLDLSPFLVESNRIHPGEYFFPHDGHLTPAGQDVVARALASALE